MVFLLNASSNGQIGLVQFWKIFCRIPKLDQDKIRHHPDSEVYFYFVLHLAFFSIYLLHEAFLLKQLTVSGFLTPT